MSIFLPDHLGGCFTMIISASYRTDIPAFYGSWFMNRINEGYCQVRNPYNGLYSRISLLRADVQGIVFWTRNPAPFSSNLRVIEEKGYPFYIHFTITGYPSILEANCISSSSAADIFRQLASDLPEGSLVWRYDPILLTSVTPIDFHIKNFTFLASSLAGYTDEVVISFARIYSKTRKNLDLLAGNTSGFKWYDPDNGFKKSLALKLSSIAELYGMRLSVCAQRNILTDGLKDASCIDPYRLSRVAGYSLKIPPLKPHRPEGCGCYSSRDIGEYDTCINGCVYCYAVSSLKNARSRYRAHDPKGSSILPLQVKTSSDREHGKQGKLFASSKDI